MPRTRKTNKVKSDLENSITGLNCANMRNPIKFNRESSEEHLGVFPI